MSESQGSDQDITLETCRSTDKGPFPIKTGHPFTRAEMRRGNVLVAFGTNLSGPWGEPAATLARALAALDRGPTRVIGVSPVYRTAPMGRPHQPDYLNGVALLKTSLSPMALLRRLKGLEHAAGRRGSPVPWGARTLDLDILDYRGRTLGWNGAKPEHDQPGPKPLILPHPHLHQRGFVLKPLADLVPEWRHPVLHRTASAFWREAVRRGGADSRIEACQAPAAEPPNN